MKQFVLKFVCSPLRLGVLLLSIIGLYSCMKDGTFPIHVSEPLSPQSAIATPVPEPCESHAYDLIHTAAIGLLLDSRNDVFKGMVHQMAAQEFDGEESVLLKDLNEYMGTNLLNSKLINGLNAYGQKSAISKFTADPFWDNFQTLNDQASRNEIINGFNYCGETSYLHIYIPNLDSVDLSENPTIVMGYEENDECIFPGYQLDQNGTVKVVDVDETFSEQHLVWVIGINEHVDAFGKLPDESYQQTIPQTNAQRNTNSRATNFLKVNVKDIQVTMSKDEKKKWECWCNGALEIAQYSISFYPNECKRSCVLGNGSAFVKVKKKNFGKIQTAVVTAPSDVAALGPVNGCTPNKVHPDGKYESTLYGNKQIISIFYEKDNKFTWDYILDEGGCSNWLNAFNENYSNGNKLSYTSKRQELLGEFYYHTFARHNPLPSIGKESQWFDLKHIKVRFQSVLLD